MTRTTTATPDDFDRRLELLGLRGLRERLDEFLDAPWLPRVVEIEEEDRARRGLERRLRNGRLGRFKPFADFDPTWPKVLDHDHLAEVFRLGFVEEAANVILVGQNGVGKTMIAKNLAYQAILRGHTARFVTASELLNDLAAQETGSALSRRLKQYCHWRILVIDEVGYLASSSRHGDLLFEVINRRYQEKSIILTTNRVFAEWGEVFPSSTCVVTMIDRLIHKAEVIKIEGESYRLKEAKEREEKRRAQRPPKGKGREKGKQKEEEQP
jgi:DNA replication protein DnaC